LQTTPTKQSLLVKSQSKLHCLKDAWNIHKKMMLLVRK